MKTLTPSFKSLIVSILTLILFQFGTAYAQYLGVTCGYDYGHEVTGPYSVHTNTSLYNPVSTNPNATWTDWAAQLQQAGVDFVCPNLEGSQPNTSKNPTNMAPFVTILNNQGNIIKLAIFDDNASSWVAQCNQANGRGYSTAYPFDVSNTNNWRYIYDFNYKLFYQTVPDAQRFKINGRPVIIIWTGGKWAITNGQGNFSRAFTYVRQCCQRDFGFNPFIIASQDTLTTDTTCNDPSIIDAIQGWYAPPSQPGTLETFNGVKIGAFAPSYQTPDYSNYMPANHGSTLSNALVTTVGGGALLTLGEGFTDWAEELTLLRVRNIDTNGNSLSYNQTWYDFPNQRIALLRRFSRNPFPGTLKFEAEGCDWYGGAAGGNGQVNFYRNGNIAIENTGDTGGGWDVGWMQSGEWLEWTNVSLNGTPHFVMRVASPNSGIKAHFVIDGTVEPSQTIPNTGGWQTYTNMDFGSYGTYSQSYHDVRLVFDNGGLNINWWETTIAGGTSPTFSTGTFTSDSVLSMAGSEVYGVSMGNSGSETTANGYSFSSYPSSNISYGGSQAGPWSGFLAGGGTTGDTGLDAVLNDAELGGNSGVLTLNNLTPGTTYKALFLESDTRSGVGTRTFQMTTGSAASANQSYAFQGGSPSMGGYILCTFTATGTSQTFTNTQAGYGYQFNAVLIGH